MNDTQQPAGQLQPPDDRDVAAGAETAWPPPAGQESEEPTEPGAAQPAVLLKAGILLGGLMLVNAILWILTWRSSGHFGFLLGGHGRSAALLTGGAAALAYGFGLRHAVDADHIAAIDNTTRKLMQEGRRPVAVGFFFSLGHSTVVFLLCAGLAFSAAYIQRHLPQWQSLGAVLGTLISAVFLYLIGFINLVVLRDLWRRLRGGKAGADSGSPLEGGGLLARLFRPMLRLVDQSWKMYFIGFLFGLGFDTATEVGILTLSARSGQAGLPFWALLLLPALFTAGMCLVDTVDGILMLGAYGWAFLAPARKLFYNAGITLLSVLVAFVIGTYEILQIVEAQFSLHGPFWKVFDRLDFDNLGFVIVGAFVVAWALAVVVYRRMSPATWRAEVEADG